MSQKKFDFTVDDIIAEFDKKKADPSAVHNIIEDYDEEFSEELSPNGEYVPRHAKPAPPEETAIEETSPDTAQTAASEEEITSEETSANISSSEPDTIVDTAAQDKTDKLEDANDLKDADDLKDTNDLKSDEPKASGEPETDDKPTVSEDKTASSEEPADDQNNDTSEDIITTGNNIDDISDEETNKPAPEQTTANDSCINDTADNDTLANDTLVNDVPANEEVSSEENSDDKNMDNTPPETESARSDAPSEEDHSWENILPENSPTIEESVDDAIADLDSEELEEDETAEEEDAESGPADTDENDDEIIDDEPQDSPDSNTPDDIPPFNPEPISLTAAETAADAEKKTKKNILKEILPWKGDTVFEMIRKVVFIIAVIIFVGAGVMLASTLIQSNRAVKDLEQIKEIVTTTAKTTIDSEGNVITIAPTEEEEQQHNIDIMSYYKGISDKVVGFIELEGCDIYQPVVQDPEDTTNTYYLTHTYYDEQNKGGAIFMDYRCTVSEDYVSPNLVLYGHNQEDGTMFGNLKNYKQDLDFYAANPTVTLRTDYESGTYLIYAYFVTNALEKQDSNGEVFHYHDYIEALNDEATFDWYMNEVQSRNQIISPVKAEFGDKLLVLSTCSNEFSNSRFVVFARKLRDGESVSDYDFTSATFNPYARGVDWTAIMSGETTIETEETTAPEETDEEDSDTTTKKKKKKTSATDEENDGETVGYENSDANDPVDADVTTVPPDASDEDGDAAEETTTKKKKKTTAETTEETAEETTSKKKKSTTAETSEETTAEETTKKKSKKTTTETTAEETTSKKNKSSKETTAVTSDTEETTVTSVPETETEETTTVTAN